MLCAKQSLIDAARLRVKHIVTWVHSRTDRDAYATVVAWHRGSKSIFNPAAVAKTNLHPNMSCRICLGMRDQRWPVQVITLPKLLGIAAFGNVCRIRTRIRMEGPTKHSGKD